MGFGESKLRKRASQSQDVSRVPMGVTEEPWSRTVTGVTAPVRCLPHLQQSWVLQPSLGQGWHRIHEAQVLPAVIPTWHVSPSPQKFLSLQACLISPSSSVASGRQVWADELTDTYFDGAQ